jgi:Arc/MetJ family transcription regulator
MLICMRTTLNIDGALLTAAMRAAGVDSKTRVIELALEKLIQAAAMQRIAALHGAVPKAKAPPRRRIRKRPA